MLVACRSVVTKFAIKLAGPGRLSAQAFIEAILDFAKAREIDQLTLAQRAGISAESLSRLKRAGGCRLSTALDLARAAGLATLELSEPSLPKVAASIAARKLSAGRRRPISARELVEALRSDEPLGQVRVHLYGFFEELPIELVHDVILDEELDFRHLVWLAEVLGTEGETRDWLTEMAGNGLADAA